MAKELWLAVNKAGVYFMEHEGDYADNDLLVKIQPDGQGNVKVTLIKPQL